MRGKRGNGVGFRYNTEKLKQIIDNLSVLTGVSMGFLDADYRYLYKRTRENDFCASIHSQAEEKCWCSDQQLLERCGKSHRYESHFCHAGLYDACMPILKDQAIAGYVMMGQIRLVGAEKEFSSDNEELNEKYREVPCLTQEQIDSLRMLLPEILFQNAIQFDDFMNEVTGYIRKHLSEKLMLSDICAEFHVSKNYLYQMFREAYRCTVNEYILRLRMEEAKALLKETKDPVYMISEKVGIDNYPYFCRLFKGRCGVSPTEYRKNEKAGAAKKPTEENA